MNMIWNLFVFSAGFAIRYWKEIQMKGYIQDATIMIVVFLAAIAVNCVEQQWLVNFTKVINPEKRGSVYDMKFREKWLDSCDEAEVFQIYQCAYKPYINTQKTCIVLWLLCFIGSNVWNIGVMPVLMITVLWGISITSYFFESMKLEKRGSR